MGQRGPAPKPTRLKLLDGNPGHRPISTDEPQPTPGFPERPDWLLLLAGEEWEHVRDTYGHTGAITTVDRTALAAYCQTYARWREVEEALGPLANHVTMTDKGYIQQHPYVAIRNQLLAQLSKLAAQLGITPASRTRVAASKEEKEKARKTPLFKGGGAS